MIKGYPTAILLIEFDGDKSFALTGQSEVAVELDNRSPQARLVLLLLHFPKLRCAQCPGVVWQRIAKDWHCLLRVNATVNAGAIATQHNHHSPKMPGGAAAGSAAAFGDRRCSLVAQMCVGSGTSIMPV
jgi:hypothetical protein